MGKHSRSGANQDTAVLDRTHDNCGDCGTPIPAGDVFCRACE
jgi:hypothetical protein